MDPVGSVYFIPTKFGSLGGDQLVDIFSHENLSPEKWTCGKRNELPSLETSTVF